MTNTAQTLIMKLKSIGLKYLNFIQYSDTDPNVGLYGYTSNGVAAK